VSYFTKTGSFVRILLHIGTTFFLLVQSTCSTDTLAIGYILKVFLYIVCPSSQLSDAVNDVLSSIHDC
jgi:hypothetical protein